MMVDAMSFLFPASFLLVVLTIILGYVWKKKTFFKKTIDSLKDGVIVVDNKNRIVYGNCSAEEAVGQSIRNIIGKPLDSIRPDWSDFMHICQSQDETSKDVLVKNGDKKRVYNLTFSSSYDTGIHDPNWVVVIKDVTKMKEVENQLRNALNTCKLMEMKDRFISAVTHELRTPLVSVKGYLDYIMSDDFGNIPQNLESNLKVVKRNADQLLSLTDDLLDIRRIEAGRLQLDLKPIGFNEVVRNCFAEITPFTRDRHQNLHIDIPEEGPAVKADRVRLNQVLMNLLINASKFTPENGHITLRVLDRAEFIEVHVIDTGIGLKNQDLERVFEPFATIQKPTYIKGTGLGLSVSKGLVEAHGGRIWAESAGEGKGSTFSFTLPKWKAVPWEAI